MRRFALVLAFVLLMAAPPLAEAVGIVGTLNIAANVGASFQWVDNITGLATSLDLANAADFSPDTSNFLVTTAGGDFAGLPGSVGSIKDFSYTGSSGSFPGPVLAAWQTVGTLVIDLTSITSVITSCSSGCTNTTTNPSLSIEGTGLFHMPGKDDTFGVFNFTSQGVSGQTQFSFSATDSVPEPTTLLLLGSGLVALGAAAGRRRRNT